MKRFLGFMLCCVMVMGLGAANGEGQDQFQVSLVLLQADPHLPEPLVYDYEFLEASSEQLHRLSFRSTDFVSDEANSHLFRATKSLGLPRYNQRGDQAVYLLSEAGLGYIRIGGVPYVVSTSESPNPASTQAHFHRTRVLSRQMEPIVKVTFDGVPAQPFTLSLGVQPWSTKQPYQASRTIDVPADSELDLFAMFATGEQQTMLRHFALTELSWDLQSLAGVNQFFIQVAPMGGVECAVEGSAESGFELRFYQKD